MFAFQKGFSQILVLLLLLLALPIGVFLARNPTFFKPKADEISNKTSVITIYATGTQAYNFGPEMILKIKGEKVKKFTVDANAIKGELKTYTYLANSKITPDQVRIDFNDDFWVPNNDKNLGVDKINIDGIDYQTEDSTTFSFGSLDAGSGCGGGFKKSEWLVCNGYFQYRAKSSSVQSAPAQDKNYTIKVGNLDRTYQVHLPPNYASSPFVPMVIVYHGGASNIEQIKKTLGFNATGDKNNFMLVYPQGVGDSSSGKILGNWNAGSCCEDGKKLSTADDIGFIGQMIDQLKKDYKVDSDRIYATGMSNGSMMTFKTGCELSDKIAAIGSSGAPGLMEPCTKNPVPVIYFHGTADRCAPYNGMMSGDCLEVYLSTVLGTKVTGLPRWPIDSAPGYMDKWKAHNGLYGEGGLAYQNKSASCKSWGYYTPKEVMFCTIAGLGHTWPGQISYGDDCAKGVNDIGCKATIASSGVFNNDIIANDQIWIFFLRHPKEH